MTEVLTPQKYLRGLMSKTEVAEALGIEAGSVGCLLSRMRAGVQGIYQWFPAPVGKFGNVNVWDEEQIDAFVLVYNGLTPEEKASATKSGS